MLKSIVAVRALEGYRLWLQFEDGIQGEVDVAQNVSFTGVFAPLSQPDYFAHAQADPDTGAVVWPNGADLDPDVLYAQITGQPLPIFEDR